MTIPQRNVKYLHSLLELLHEVQNAEISCRKAAREIILANNKNAALGRQGFVQMTAQEKADWEDAYSARYDSFVKCPHCSKTLPAHIVDTRSTGSKGGKVKSPLKARSSEQARAAINARWAKAKLAAR